MTFTFNIDEVFQQVLVGENNAPRYVVKDDPLGEEESMGHSRDVIFAAGAYLDEGALTDFLRERSNPLNRHRYIHNKFILVDPLSDEGRSDRRRATSKSTPPTSCRRTSILAATSRSGANTSRRRTDDRGPILA